MPQCRNINICMQTAELLHRPFPVKALTRYNADSTLQVEETSQTE